ncbi:intein N-terminal splicing region [Monaibacterium marinum]|uniref:Intein N-terminal splicing region n=1 Tax=Pontivivens marinum TaxID=1690039 RepID=A0A2C9CPE7_9RHOB|nr:Hint domain-containing protein [Monaibacterium marinum]SOH93391.1 intein N-terminal splicing region [Monaibacterium marinum]
MAIQQLIINGGFESGNANWSGTDTEIGLTEAQYFSGGSDNKVAEMDGNPPASVITVMQQTFTVTNPTSTSLNFDTGLRDASNPDAGLEGFRVEILDSAGNQIVSADFFPTANSLQPVSVPVTFTSSGNYIIRFTELGPSNALGALIDNVSIFVCFANGTNILTAKGQRPIEELRVGDDVLNLDGKRRTIRWIGSRQFDEKELRENPKLYPVRITAGAMGEGLPRRDLLVSQQHRMLVSSKITERLFKKNCVLVAAVKLTKIPGIYVDESTRAINYTHLLFEDHEVIIAEGSPSESLFTGPEALKMVPTKSRDEIVTIFPQLMNLDYRPKSAQLIAKGKKRNEMIERHLKNRKSLYCNS